MGPFLYPAGLKPLEELELRVVSRGERRLPVHAGRTYVGIAQGRRDSGAGGRRNLRGDRVEGAWDGAGGCAVVPGGRQRAAAAAAFVTCA